MKEFLKSFFSKKVALNFLAVILVLFALLVGVYYSLNFYTNHGDKVEVPNVKKKTFKAAKHDLHKMGLEIVVTDTMYLKNLPADIVLEQMPASGKTVKPGRVVYVVINAGHSPIRAVPEIVDNSSAREAKAKLQALGFKRVEFQYVPGEKEWVYGLKCDGKAIKNGDKVSVDSKLVILVGDGTRDPSEEIETVPSNFYFDNNWEDALNSRSQGSSGSGGSGSDHSSGATSDYSDEQVEAEIENNLDADLQNLLREKHQRESNQKIENGAANAPSE